MKKSKKTIFSDADCEAAYQIGMILSKRTKSKKKATLILRGAFIHFQVEVEK